jgi:hypothetical protein
LREEAEIPLGSVEDVLQGGSQSVPLELKLKVVEVQGAPGGPNAKAQTPAPLATRCWKSAAAAAWLGPALSES